jgi:hypothetical protein
MANDRIAAPELPEKRSDSSLPRESTGFAAQRPDDR